MVTRRLSLGATLPLLAFAGWGAAAGGCELIVDAHEYTLYEGYCTECTNADLERAPCPAPSEAPDDGETYVYAARAIDFGDKQDFVGIDVNCSAEPVPMRCQPRPEATMQPWTAHPGGADNAMADRIFGPLELLAEQYGFDFGFDLNYEAGKGGFLLVVEDYNGTPDDPHVTVSLHGSPGVAGKAVPRWDGTDEWDRFEEGPGKQVTFFKLVRHKGYIANGRLVLDARERGQQIFRIDTGFGDPFLLLVSEIMLVGRIDQANVTNLTVSAVADLSSAYDSIPGLSQSLATCIPGAAPFIEELMRPLLLAAADSPVDPNVPADELCNGVSFAFSVTGQRARLGGYSLRSPNTCAP